MKKLYVVSKLGDYNIIRFNTVEIQQETKEMYYLVDNINVLGHKYTFPKTLLNIEFEDCFVTKNKSKIKNQLKRVYENISKETEENISKLEYKISQLREIQERNRTGYEKDISFIDTMK